MGSKIEVEMDELKAQIKELRFQFEQKAIRRVERYVLARHVDEVTAIINELRTKDVLPL